MKLFNKKGNQENFQRSIETPTLPELPRLPELPDLEEEESQHIHQLPSFPSNSYGTKFSHDTIKEAVTGGREDDEEFDADEFADEDEDRMMHEPPKKPQIKEFEGDWIPSKKFGESGETSRKTGMVTEPVFIRIDKFEEAMAIFKETKKKISEIERDFSDIKKVKEAEEKELKAWEKEMKFMKEQMEKIDRDVFSKIE